MMRRCDLSAVGGSASVPGGVEEASWLWIVSILFRKKHQNSLHLSTVKEWERLSMGLRSLLMVENSVLGLSQPD